MNKPEHTGEFSSGAHLSSWAIPCNIQSEALGSNQEADVVVVGAGIAGLMTAYRLLGAGKSVIVVEDGIPGSGETGRTSAHLTVMLDRNYSEYISKLGQEKAQMLADSHGKAIDLIEQIAATENIDCDFRRVDGFLFVHPSDTETNLEEEYEKSASLGLDVEIVEHMPGVLKDIRALKYRNQGQFHPLKFLYGLWEAVLRKGGKVYTNTHADKIESSGITSSAGFTIKAEHVVVATNSPVNNKFIMMFKQVPHRTYMIGALIEKGKLPYALWNDTGDYQRNEKMPPYHYIRLQELDDQHDLLLCGGEDHETGNPQDTEPPLTEQERYKILEDWTREHFEIKQVVHHWSGQVMQSVDGVSFVGRNPFDKNNVYIVTGDSGDGLTNGAIASMLLPDLITGKDNPWESLYKPSRAGLKSALTGTWELVAYMFSSKPEPAKEEAISSIPPGEGKIVEIEKQKCGVYRDEDGSLVLVSAVCPHMGCTIGWNPDEKSWDCPCHGSRFTPTGKVVNGPANDDLEIIRERPE